MTASRRYFYDQDANVDDIHGRTIAVIGYGNQGRAQALNLRDSGLQVCIGQRQTSSACERAKQDGFAVYDIATAVQKASIHLLLLPDEVQGEVFRDAIQPYIKAGDTLVFATGFSVHYQHVKAGVEQDVVLVAPKGPGLLLRSSYEQGSGIFGLVGVEQDASGQAWKTALALSKALGCTRIAAIEASFQEEAETDLFGEQVVLCGGVTELVKAAVETLIKAGYAPELAYIECFHELKQCVDLLWSMGLPGMWKAISDTAEYGAMSRGPRLISDQTRETMQTILQEIKDGTFAKEWDAECKAGKPLLQAGEAHDADSELQSVGEKMRLLMKKQASRQDRSSNG